MKYLGWLLRAGRVYASKWREQDVNRDYWDWEGGRYTESFITGESNMILTKLEISRMNYSGIIPG